MSVCIICKTKSLVDNVWYLAPRPISDFEYDREMVKLGDIFTCNCKYYVHNKCIIEQLKFKKECLKCKTKKINKYYDDTKNIKIMLTVLGYTILVSFMAAIFSKRHEFLFIGLIFFGTYALSIYIVTYMYNPKPSDIFFT